MIHNNNINYPENLSKYTGSLITRKSKYIFKVMNNKKIIEYHEFPFPPNSDNEQLISKQNAIQTMKDYSITKNLVKNTYTIDHQNKILIVNINSQTDITFTIDENDIDKLEEYNWYIIDGHIGTMISVNNNKNIKTSRKKIYLHQYLTQNVNTIHQDGNKMNNTRSNLIILQDENKTKKIQHFNHQKRKDNKTGYTGVYKGKTKNKEYYEVKGKDFKGNNIYQRYDIDTYGIKGAYDLACDFRDKFINQSYNISI